VALPISISPLTGIGTDAHSVLAATIAYMASSYYRTDAPLVIAIISSVDGLIDFKT
jgi:hypothetical protein